MTNGSTYIHHFRDQRPPHEVKFSLERELRVLFTTTTENGKLCMQAKATIAGVSYEFLLCFENALPAFNDYSLTMEVLWSNTPISNREYYGKAAKGWFELWTCDFKAINPPLLNEDNSPLYLQRCKEASHAEYALNSIEAIQSVIIDAMKRGASFRDAHKEGGTDIYWRNDRFVRSAYGDYPDEQYFTCDTEFLKMLRQFCHWDVTRNSGKDQVSEIDAWRLIMRRMNLNHP